MQELPRRHAERPTPPQRSTSAPPSLDDIDALWNFGSYTNFLTEVDSPDAATADDPAKVPPTGARSSARLGRPVHTHAQQQRLERPPVQVVMQQQQQQRQQHPPPPLPQQQQASQAVTATAASSQSMPPQVQQLSVQQQQRQQPPPQPLPSQSQPQLLLQPQPHRPIPVMPQPSQQPTMAVNGQQAATQPAHSHHLGQRMATGHVTKGPVRPFTVTGASWAGGQDLRAGDLRAGGQDINEAELVLQELNRKLISVRSQYESPQTNEIAPPVRWLPWGVTGQG